ncbi:hypothetical protein V501_00408 [Pseudogymnoascus sp. VKM F-4519 (FW-2642)]|nr:hypothetical protein V501_00408 [Pseudogymnoascus sp. VKM F-4519 (FW-2642)]
MPKSLLPYEGLTVEALFAPIRLTLLQPLFIGPLLLGLYRFPSFVTKLLPPNVHEVVRSTYLLKGLGILFGIGLLRKVNNRLSQLVLNNFTKDKTWDWTKEIVVVTGGSGGIGGLIVRMFAENNIKVIILDVSAPTSTTKLSNVYFYQVDITSSEKIRDVAEKIRKDHGDPTVLINNAGVGINKTILDETEAEMRLVFEVNTIAHFLLVKELIPAMIKRNHGHIVTVASMASFMIHAQNVDYACSKASALAFHEGLSQELKSRYNAKKNRPPDLGSNSANFDIDAKIKL